VSNDNVLKLIQPGAFDDNSPKSCGRELARCWRRRSRPRSRIFSPSMLISRPRMAANALCATAICRSARW
jgi:hypothetical protein